MENENVEVKNTNKSVAPVASVTLGICSMLFAFLWYVGLPCSILSMIIGKHCVKKYASKGGKAGFVLGLIGLIMFAVIYVGICVLVLILKDEMF